jgi:hypothetical protein
MTNDERAIRLLQEAYSKGELSDDSTQALLSAEGAAAQVAAALGSEGTSGEVLLVSILVDDSSSIAGHAPEVCAGHNLLLESLLEPSSTEVLVLTRYLNRGLLSPYRPLGEAVRLSDANYTPGGSTPLHLQSVLTLGTVMAKAREEQGHGRRVRTFTLILTDAADNASKGATAQHVQAIVRDMLDFSHNHIVAGMGIGQEVYFREVFSVMGIPPGWVLTASSSVEDIRAVFRTIRSALLTAARSESAFRQLLPGPSGSASA